MSESKSTTCTRLSEVMNISHDRVNRFLLREAYAPRDLFDEAKGLLNPIGGALSVDTCYWTSRTATRWSWFPTCGPASTGKTVPAGMNKIVQYIQNK